MSDGANFTLFADGFEDARDAIGFVAMRENWYRSDKWPTGDVVEELVRGKWRECSPLYVCYALSMYPWDKVKNEFRHSAVRLYVRPGEKWLPEYRQL